MISVGGSHVDDSSGSVQPGSGALSLRAWMAPYFAVFNCHLNDASTRADEDFKRTFGEDWFFEKLHPLHANGIMDIFSQDTAWAGFWIAKVHGYVNEDAATPDPRSETQQSVQQESNPEVSTNEATSPRITNLGGGE